jgi:hypothetical protein
MSKPLLPAREYHEDMGAVLWWRFPVEEPPYVGSPLDCGYAVTISAKSCDGSEAEPITMFAGGWLEDYYTHFQEIDVPEIED